MVVDTFHGVTHFFVNLKKVPVTFVLLLILFSSPAGAFEILLGTGKPGTFSHFTGKAICRAVNRHAADIQCTPVPAPGDMHNLTNLQGGSLDISLVNSRIINDAVNKTGSFRYLDIHYDNLRFLLPLYDVPFSLVVRRDADISSLSELKGKRINAGAPLSPQRLAVDVVLQAKKWTKKDFSLVEELPPSQSQDSMAFCHGTIQAMLHVGVHPDPALQQLFNLCNADLVDMDDKDIQNLVTSHPAFFNINISAAAYPEQSGDVSTFGTRVMLVASADLDQDTVYAIMDAIYRSQKQLKGAHPALAGFSGAGVDDPGFGMERHPGAARYFSEH